LQPLRPQAHNALHCTALRRTALHRTALLPSAGHKRTRLVAAAAAWPQG